MPWGPRFKEVAQYQTFFKREVASAQIERARRRTMLER